MILPNKSQSCMERFKMLKQVKPQQTALLGGFLLLFSSGIHIGYGFFQWTDVDVPWTKSTSSTLIAFAVVAWYIGSIFAFALAPMSLKFFNRQMIYLISNSVVALSAILLIAIPQYYYSVLIARFIAGIGHGFAYVAVCQHFGEISIDTQRGRIGTSLHLFMLKGGIISGNVIINYFSVDSRMDPNRFLGICCLFLCCFAILATLTLYKESIVTLIQSSTREDAIKTMMLLQGQFEETAEITDTYNELKMMVSEDKLKSADIFSEGNLKPLIMVLLLRMSFVLSFNFAIKYIHFTLVHDSKPLFDYTFILNFAHTFVVVVVLFTIDRYGRRAHILLSAGATSVVFIIFGCLQAFYSVSALLIFIMLTLFELFSAIGLGLTAHIYSTEAFVTTKKPGSISFTSIIEHCLQIMFVVWVQIVTDAYLLCIILLLISGIVLGFITIYFDRHLPETKNLSIREARNKFLQ